MNAPGWLKHVALATVVLCTNAYATEEDIYSIHFSEDGKHLVTGGAGGFTLSENQKHSGGIKIWNSATGTLIEALGNRTDLDKLFGGNYGRVGNRRWGISNFKDVVLTGSYPNGTVSLIPSSLGQISGNHSAPLPSFIGGSIEFGDHQAKRIEISELTAVKGNCELKSGVQDYAGPIVPSNNGHYAAIVVNTCFSATAVSDSDPDYEFRSHLLVMDLTSHKIIKTFSNIDAGVYALGISSDGSRIAYVGRDQFSVIDVENGNKHIVELYSNGTFLVPKQFSTLQFSHDGKKLVSLHNIYDIESGVERAFEWSADSDKRPKRISSVKVSPDLSYFVLVYPKRSLIVFDDQGLPQSHGEADSIAVINSRTGKRTDLAVSNSKTEGKRCVTDISPDSARIAIGCKGGLIRVYSASSGKLIWKKTNVGKETDNGLMQVHSNEHPEFLSLR